MLKNILEIKGVSELGKKEQQGSIGGVGCPTYPASQCSSCGGFPLPNGCCIGDRLVHMCLNGGFSDDR